MCLGDHHHVFLLWITHCSVKFYWSLTTGLGTYAHATCSKDFWSSRRFVSLKLAVKDISKSSYNTTILTIFTMRLKAESRIKALHPNAFISCLQISFIYLVVIECVKNTPTMQFSHWNFQKFSAKIIYAIIDWVCLGFPK